MLQPRQEIFDKILKLLSSMMAIAGAGLVDGGSPTDIAGNSIICGECTLQDDRFDIAGKYGAHI